MSDADFKSPLGADDAAALDALVEAGLDPSGVGASIRERARHIAGLLALLEMPGAAGAARDDLLVNVTMARILRSRDLAGRVPAGRALSPLDPEGSTHLDALVESGWSATDDGSGRVAGLLGLLDEPDGAGAAPDLVDRTLAHVQDHLDHEGKRFRLPAPEERLERRGRGLSLADVGGIAALILVGFAIVWPMLIGMREASRISGCTSHLHDAARGFTHFAANHDGRLPAATAGFTGPIWNVGDPDRSHSANLFKLVRDGYTDMGDLACPGNPEAPTWHADAHAADWRSPEEVSFSYQVFDPRLPPRWQSMNRLVVLADRSPVIDRARRGELFDPLAPSHNHTGRGQNVLFSDASVSFIGRPLLADGDNIWLPEPVARSANPRLTGTERPAHAQDAFVAP